MQTPGLDRLREELAKHHVEPEVLGDECLRQILACASKAASAIPVEELETSGLFVHYIKGLATHVAGLLGAFGPDWPVPHGDVIAKILRDHRSVH